MTARLAMLSLSGIAIAAATLTAQQQRPACYRYDPGAVSLEGRLERHVFPGPPNYASVGAGDAAETGFYLRLASPVCFAADSAEAADEPRRSVTFIQLNLDSAGYARLRPLLGKVTRIRGRAYAAQSGHHHAPVVLWFDALDFVGRATR